MMSDSTAPRQAVSLSLSAEVVATARDLTDDLSGTVDALLAKYVHEARRNRGLDDPALNEVLTALNVFHAEHGFLSDEFPSF